ncbi:hypothetical protein PMO31116_04727 [Pandoraea morbifera]|uniref:Uncharacterized protein n=1 Tax=Pandoraea morbifera TaxID=2508300 RepID=A0A5E4YTG3_9BURK|nr:hypothetical protein [Pandoraea morbifera]VVE52119.1 hypothetical protein PMO31116_04727 [Pandoraea morbifera]
MHELKTVTFDASQYQLVPKVPTDEMRDAGNVHVRNRSVLYDAWKSMLAAAPTPAAQSAGQEAVTRYERDDTGRITSSYEPSPEEIRVCRDAVRREFGNDGTDGYYIRILKAVHAVAAPVNGGERDLGQAIHYPECWDTAAYPTPESALAEVYASFECTNDECAKHAADAPHEDGERPSDCSGEPECCPQNEGYGCHCGARNSDVQRAADAPQVGEPDPEYATVARQLGDMAANDTVWDNATLIHRAIALLERAALSSTAKMGAFSYPTIEHWLTESGDVCGSVIGDFVATMTPIHAAHQAWSAARATTDMDAKVGGDEREADIDAHVIERFATILAEISLTLKGVEQPLQRHSYHDLPKLVAELKLEVDLHRANEARAALSADGGERKEAVRGSIEGTAFFMRSNPSEQVCVCCPPGGGHIFRRGVDWDEWDTNRPAHFGNDANVLVSNVLDNPATERKRIRVTVEVLDAAIAASTAKGE